MVGLLRAGPTPKKRRKGGRSKKQQARVGQEDLSHKLKRARTSHEQDSGESESEGGRKRAMPRPVIPAEFEYLDR
jgi:hypothetical protein